MLFNVLLVLVAIATVVLPIVVFFKSRRYDRVSNFFGALVGVPLAGGFVSIMIVIIVGNIAGTHEEPTERHDLQAISMGKDIHGRFFLGTGYVDNELTYSYYVKNDDGSFKADSIAADEVTIVESDETPHIQEITEYFPDWVAPDFDWDSRYVLYVPKGSIKPMINMDLPSN